MTTTENTGKPKQEALKARIIRDFTTIRKNAPLYHITINPLETIHAKDLQFRMGKHLSSFKEMCFKEDLVFMYFFVIEYSKTISNGNEEITTNRLGQHVHLIIHTTIGTEDILNFPDNGLDRLIAFLNFDWRGKVVIEGERIDNRNDLENLPEYFSKQLHLLTEDNYHSNI